jgi:hypothetical protein
MLQVWCTLDGMVNLFNSRVLQEVEDDVENAVKFLADDMVRTIKARRKDIK